MNIKSLFLFCTLAPCFPVYAIDYYCPRTNIFLEQLSPTLEDKGFMAPKNSVYEPFPKKESDVGKGPNGGQLYFDVRGCSTKDFLCLRFMQHQTLKKDKEFFLALPRQIQLGKEYSFKGISIVTSESAISPRRIGGESKIPIIQAILWQKIDGIEQPIKLTVEQGRGVTYWDGLSIRSNKLASGETCILLGKEGFFSDVAIQEMAPSDKQVEY